MAIDKIKVLLFIATFLLVFLILFQTLSDNLCYDSDFIQIPSWIEGHTEDPCRPIAHVLWGPLGKCMYWLSHRMGYEGRSVMPLELLNIVLASLGSALFLVLCYELTNNVAIAACLTVLLSFSNPWWYQFVHTKLYSGGFLFNILSIYLYTRKEMRLKPLIFAVVNGMAILFHISNVFIIVCTVAHLYMTGEKRDEKILLIIDYLLLILLFTWSGYFFINKYSGLGIDFIRFFRSASELFTVSWPNFFKYIAVTFIGGNVETFPLREPWYKIFWLASYSGLFTYSFLSSVKNLAKNRLFYLCVLFIPLFLLGGKKVSPNNYNVFSFLISLTVIFALTLARFNSFHKGKKVLIMTLLVALALSMGYYNFHFWHSRKDMGSDHFYKASIIKPREFISSGDVFASNGAIQYYLEYYLHCKVYHLEGYIYGRILPRLISELKQEIASGKQVKIFLDTRANYYDKVIVTNNKIYSNALLLELSEDFSFTLLYENTDDHFVIYSLTLPPGN